jgi:gliding motility-associated-like protein
VTVELVEEPAVDLGDDRSVCTGTSFVLQAPAGPYYSYYWNGVPGGEQYEVTGGGYYSLTVVSPCDSVSDGIYVTEVEVPEVDLGEDRVMFPGESVELDAGMGYDSYLWQNGYQGQVLAVDETTQSDPGHAYWVEVMLGGCKSTDTVLIEYFSVWVPSVITPNGDGKNDLFLPDPERWGAITTHRMTVYNRWGEKVWESEDFPSGWDGRQNGRPVADGTYFWVLEVRYGPQSVSQVLKGTLTVIGSSG